MLRRSAPARRRKPPKARKPMRQVSERRAEADRAAGIVRTSTLTVKATAPKLATRRKPALPARQVRTLAERSGGMCEITMTGCTGRAVDPSHRVATKAGGRHGEAAVTHARLSNVLHACRSCHEWAHSNPAAAKSEGVGWALEEWQDPTEWPVLYRGVLSYLGDLGEVVPYEEASA